MYLNMISFFWYVLTWKFERGQELRRGSRALSWNHSSLMKQDFVETGFDLFWDMNAYTYTFYTFRMRWRMRMISHLSQFITVYHAWTWNKLGTTCQGPHTIGTYAPVASACSTCGWWACPGAKCSAGSLEFQPWFSKRLCLCRLYWESNLHILFLLLSSILIYLNPVYWFWELGLRAICMRSFSSGLWMQSQGRFRMLDQSEVPPACAKVFVAGSVPHWSLWGCGRWGERLPAGPILKSSVMLAPSMSFHVFPWFFLTFFLSYCCILHDHSGKGPRRSMECGLQRPGVPSASYSKCELAVGSIGHSVKIRASMTPWSAECVHCVHIVADSWWVSYVSDTILPCLQLCSLSTEACSSCTFLPIGPSWHRGSAKGPKVQTWKIF